MALWTEKYAPKSHKDVIGQPAAGEVFRAVKEWKKGSKAILLYGPTGSGKTACAQAIARELDCELIELNASEDRNAADIESKALSAATQASLFGRKKMILIDEVDGLYGQADRGAIPAISRVLDLSVYPILLTANEIYEGNVRNLLDKCRVVKFGRVNSRDISALLNGICVKEGVAAEPSAVDAIAMRSGGDVRSAILDLQSASLGRKRLAREDLLIFPRDREMNVYDSLKLIFKAGSISPALDAADNSSKDPDELLLWISENIQREYLRPADLARAYDRVSRADVFRGRIRRQQHWRFLAYQSQLQSAGVAVAKDRRYESSVNYAPPAILMSMGRTRRYRAVRDSFAGKVAAACHTSRDMVRHSYLPYLRIIFSGSREFAVGLSRDLALSPEEVAFVLGRKEDDKLVREILGWREEVPLKRKGRGA